MNTNWKEISLTINKSAVESLSNFLYEYGAEGITVTNDEQFIESENTILKAYFLEDNISSDSLVEALNHQLKNNIKNISINQLKEEDWANDWKKYFEVFKVGQYLVIKPVWQNYSAKKNDIVIDFDPGSFFGSTPHPSTKLCLEEIEKIALTVVNKDNYNILDLGSGSGILSLVLYQLGFKKITAIDIDPVAIRNSKDNFDLNKMDIKLFQGEIKDCNDTYDLIAGNLLAETIEELSEQISNKLNLGGIFIGAGITKNNLHIVEQSLNKVNIKILDLKYSDEWVLVKAIKI